MKRTLFFVITAFYSIFLFGSNDETIFQEPIVIEITDVTLGDVYYHQNDFDQPTRLVFTNLTSVTGIVYFHQNTNLLSVDFPQLTSVNRYFYFSGNTDLETINAPNLNSVTRYLYVAGNTSLQQLNVCSLSEIIQEDDDSLPYYYIRGNTVDVDATPHCFSQGAPENLQLSNNSIEENKEVNSLIGELSADTNYPNGTLEFSLEDELDSDYFSIQGSQLLTNSVFDFETKNEYSIEVVVVNQLGEKIKKEFTINITDVVNENLVTIEVTDVTMDNIYYHQNNFTNPTRLVFTNLTNVNGIVYFHQNQNLVEVEFPLLDTTDDYFYFSGNTSLERLNAPNLNSVTKYLYVSGNTLLQELNVCNLSEIKQKIDDDSLPYYYIRNNTELIDATPHCFSLGAPENLVLDNSSVSENMALNTLVGTLSADTNYPNGDLTYYLVENELDNEYFVIDGNMLLTNSPLDFESKNQYKLEIGVINQLGEKIVDNFDIDVTDVSNEVVTTIEVDGTNFDKVYYHKSKSFITPTKLVFTNLTTVDEFVYFYENVNLVEVEFPQLNSTGEYVYVDKNPSLKKLNALYLNTIHDYLYISRNNLLEEFNICNLSEILSSESNPDQGPFYYVRNNPNLLLSTTCLTYTNVSYNPVEDVVVMPAPNTLVGTFSVDNDSNPNIRYYFIDEDGNETSNSDFVIVGNGLYLAKEFNEYGDNIFNLNINALRVVELSGANVNKGAKAKSVATNTVNEKIDISVSLNISQLLSSGEIQAEEIVFFYPNPTDDRFFINTQKVLDKVSVFNLNGKLIKSFKASFNGYNVREVASGVYLVVLEEAQNTFVKKLIIK